MLSHLRRFGPRRAIVVVLALGLVGIVAVPTILAAPRLSTQAGPGTDIGQATGVGRLGRVLRADVTVLKKDGTTLVVHSERGEISAVSATSITIKGLDGVSTTFAVTAETRVREKGRQAQIADLEVGDRAMVIGKANGAGYDALLIRSGLKLPLGQGGGNGPGGQQPQPQP
jgi:hypothetical protein